MMYQKLRELFIKTFTQSLAINAPIVDGMLRVRSRLRLG